MRLLLPLFFLFSLILLPAPASACEVQITFADLNLIKGLHILDYNATGQLQGEYDTNATLTVDCSQAHLFLLKPTAQSIFTNPQETVNYIGAYLPVTINYLIGGVVVLGIAYAISRLWK